MADSGARGSNSKIRQLSGMRGLMAGLPAKSSKRPHFQLPRRPYVLQYFISTHGARRAWPIRRQDRRFRLPHPPPRRRRADVIINERDAALPTHFMLSPSSKPASKSSRSRPHRGPAFPSTRSDFDGARSRRRQPGNHEELANQVQGAGIERVRIRSVLTCESPAAFARFAMPQPRHRPHGLSLAKPSASSPPQSIGEPGTQLTMPHFPHRRTPPLRVSERSTSKARNNGVVKFVDMKFVEVVAHFHRHERAGLIAIVD